jgi:hypothetical protein
LAGGDRKWTLAVAWLRNALGDAAWYPEIPHAPAL